MEYSMISLGYICDRLGDVQGEKLWDIYYLNDLKQDIGNLQSLHQSYNLPQTKSNIKQITDD